MTSRPRLMPARRPKTSSSRTVRPQLSVALQARLLRAALWALVVLGAGSGVVALAAGSGKADTTPPAPPAASTAGPSGFAEMFVAAYLQAGEGQEEQLSPFMSSVPSLTQVVPGHLYASRVATMDAVQLTPGY